MGVLQLEKIYLRQCVINLPQGSNIPASTEEPAVNYKLQVNNQTLAESKHEVILTLAAEYKQAENLIATIQIQQAGIFLLKDYTAEQQENILQGYCVNQLFPHLSALASQLTQQAGLQPFNLPMMDFVLIAQQAKARAQAEKAAQNEAGEKGAASRSDATIKPSSLH